MGTCTVLRPIDTNAYSLDASLGSGHLGGNIITCFMFANVIALIPAVYRALLKSAVSGIVFGFIPLRKT